ncbi:hypothetical protein K2173_018172 [Erythroxylum novogranatense]|uniref:Uncharacterized protein n=1 Tax=Erythroxylum novogranatense TaxID=1862640 RepID=A0AAV8TNG5_9ROSI|nr:hypothetical protein K2173_018172 [Erythroxylum novogranatense]
MERSTLLERYRHDRRKLIEFLLASGLIKELRTPSGPADSLANIDFDRLSADHILECVKSDGVLDLNEATKRYLAESAYPATISSQAGNSYFLVSNPDLTGSPPRRMPPPVYVKSNANHFPRSRPGDPFPVEKASMNGDGNSPRYNKASAYIPTIPLGNSEIPEIALPSLSTGLSDDDLRESAYELLIITVFLSGDEMCMFEEKKKEKSSNRLLRLKGKKDKLHSQSLGSHSDLMNVVRAQMQISEDMDACIRRNFMQLAARRLQGQIFLPDIALGLLGGIFKSDFLHEKSYMKWKSRQANILEELLCSSAIAKKDEYLTIRNYAAMIREDWDSISPSERVAVLASIRQVAAKVSSLPGKFDMEGETFYWTAGYHLNLRLYQKLLGSVFDILDEGQLIQEADEILSLIKLTWSTLGITQKLHNALYGCSLFQQFVATGGGNLLQIAVHEVQKLLSAVVDDEKEGLYMKSLVCLRQCNGGELKLCLVEAVLLLISGWCDHQIQDYHLHFSQRPSDFRMIMVLISEVGVISSDDSGKTKLIRLNYSHHYTSGKIKFYVKKSTEAACRRTFSKLDLETKVGKLHPLAVLANELKLVAEREFTMFYPVLRDFCPDCLKISVVLLHEFYGIKLRPFLNEASSLSEDVIAVLSAADMLDHYLTQLYTSVAEANKMLDSFNQDMSHYQIKEISKPLILDWVISQNTHILEWTGRAFEIENWDPLSLHQRQAASVVEVFRMVEETVDQFFGLNLPMDITHLQALLSVIFHSLDTYLLKMLNQLVDKKHLYPSAPPLTRYTDAVIPLIRKKLECAVLDDDVTYKLNQLTVLKMCVRLNSLQFIQKHIGILEDGIRKSWALNETSCNQRWKKEEVMEEKCLPTIEAVDALFATTIDVIRDIVKEAINRISDFIGSRVVFWDLRDSFLFHLYRGDVESTCVESSLPHIDTVLDHICGVIDDSIRDLVVLSICRASLEGFVWILLNGGPSRAFSDSHVKMLEDDLNALKEFFVADGEGLPRSLVEHEAKFAHHILGLFSLQTESVIRMLMNASEHISIRLDSHKSGHMCLDDAYTLIRILCHKKDREASKFLKQQYQLPMSSDYDDIPSRDSTSKSPFISELLQRSASFHWTKNGEGSFRTIKKKLQEATSEIRNIGR